MKAWLFTVMFKANHRDTEDTEEMSFFPGRETTAREKCLRLRRTPLEQKPESPALAWNVKNLPGGLRSFARSPSPDRAKTDFALCTPCLCGKQNERYRWQCPILGITDGR